MATRPLILRIPKAMKRIYRKPKGKRTYVQSRVPVSGRLRGHMVLIPLECGHIEERHHCVAKKTKRFNCAVCVASQ